MKEDREQKNNDSGVKKHVFIPLLTTVGIFGAAAIFWLARIRDVRIVEMLGVETVYLLSAAFCGIFTLLLFRSLLARRFGEKRIDAALIVAILLFGTGIAVWLNFW